LVCGVLATGQQLRGFGAGLGGPFGELVPFGGPLFFGSSNRPNSVACLWLVANL